MPAPAAFSLPADVTAASFDALPYRHGAVPETHPARLGALARLLGWDAATPDGCRVLELGCGEGMNLLPLAERLPGSTFVGVDFSAGQLAVAEQARAAARLGNVRFVQADLRAYEPEAGAFDYVLAHGVYSWVAPEVRARLLAIAAQALAPQGVAYVSYHTYPAWGLIGGLRAMVRAELAGVSDPAAHLARLLPVLARALAGQVGPYAEAMRALLAEWCARPPELLLHDELEVVCEPVTFLDFTAHAGRHDLHYLAEAHFASMPLDHLPPPARAALAELAPDFLHAQQLLDLVGQRRFRNSLLVRGGPAVERTPDPAVIPQCAVGLHLRPADGLIDLTPGVPLLLTGRHGLQLSVTVPAQKAFFAALCEVAPARVPWAEALARAAALLRQSGQPAVLDPGLLAAGVVKLWAADQCDLLLVGAGDWLHLSPDPRPSALMRHQARTGLHITNRWHEVVDLSPEERRWVAGEASAAHEDALLRTGLAV
jgi:SAM-dependent methyltransferase